MAKDSGTEKNYVKAMIYVFIGLGLFIFALISAYFGGVGLFFGQGIVEVDVFTDDYKYGCTTEVDGKCTVYNESDVLASYSDYEEFRGDINGTIPLYINATTVIFSLLALVFLFLALKTSGLWGGKKQAANKDEF